MKRSLFLLFTIVVSVSLHADAEDMPNLKEPREKIYTAGQPTVDGLKQFVSTKGVRTVINLRPHTEEGARDESKELSDLNAKYHSIPVTSDSYTMEKLEEFACLLQQNKETPVLIHCSSANRVGGMWFLYRVLYEKENETKALIEAREIGMKPALEPFMLEFLQKAKTEKREFPCK